MTKLFYESADLEQYILTEAIRLKISAKYGLNYPEFDDKRSKPAKVLTTIHSEFSTISKVEDRYFVMDYLAGKFQFRTCGYIGETPDVDMMLNSALIQKRKYDSDLPYSLSVRLFGYALAVMIQMADQYNMKKVAFTGYSPELNRLYTTTIEKNKFLRADLAMLGWVVSRDKEQFVLTKT